MRRLCREKNHIFLAVVALSVSFCLLQLLVNLMSETSSGKLEKLIAQDDARVAKAVLVVESKRRLVIAQNRSKSNITQGDIDSMAVNMEVSVNILPSKIAEITLVNKGTTPIKNGPWTVYFCLLTAIRSIHHSTHNSVKVTHVNGCLHKFEPAAQFKSVSSGESFKFQFQTFSTRARTDFMPNWYIAASGLEARTILNTADENLRFASSVKKLTWDRYSAPSVPDGGYAPLMVTPTPQEIVRGDRSKGVSILNHDWTVHGEDGLENEVNYLTGKLGLKTSSSAKTKVIHLSLTPTDSVQRLSSTAHESYILQVNGSQEVISISGPGHAGVFYGVQTLLALINDKGVVPEVSIKDAPRFSYRGLMVDVGRNFIAKNDILKLLDVMAMYKMNKFHFHLSENEGWRLEIPGLEELTKVGSKKCHDLHEKTCILHQLGSGPGTNNSIPGYYSIIDYREILRYAKQRHIQVIPEFDFPGHSHAAIKSMIARHDRLVQEGSNVEASKFLLNDFEDRSKYVSVQFFTDEAVNPCINSTYTFLRHLLLHLVGFHLDIQPLTLYFFGGDEVALGAWKESPACKQFLNALNHSSNDAGRKYLMQYFLQRLSQIAQDHGVEMGGWSDAFFDEHGALLPKSAFESKEIAYYWSKSDDVKRLSSLVQGGYKIVLTPPDYVYLDHPYEPDYEERGKYWATNFIDSKKVFSFSPRDLYKGSANQNPEVLGIEGCVWGETIRDADQMNSMLFPRLLALAERSWHEASWEKITDKVERDRERTKEWEEFANTLVYRELGRLDKMGVAYRVPPPGARILNKKLKVKTALPGLRVEYSADGGVTWNDVTEDMEVDGKITLRTRSVDQNRFSRLVEFG